ncbi:hypothetical protein SPBR_08747 [Sporothrix brasiliensis 5110]|uniref:ChrR-like cupin domain-containing protein n=1 Tax=Sporothrix brasiliensis 5110 TaxID=1398154 RepID=A0A0C2IN95_9PEZI|nr:uncharacterized protein SPBR_08747 [Sporothrix brasiliensis 5110]KIH86502.1 hypothetical protein SPBR_08747 [Sporothrix brasiliensis 5110]
MAFVQKEFFTRPAHPPIGAAPVSLADAIAASTTGDGRPDQWYTIGPGIWELQLNGDPASDHKAVLQWYEPNTRSVDPVAVITHTYIEEVCFIQGGLTDVTLGQGWGPGSYAYRLPGMKHGPYQASSEGCLQFVKLVPVENQK